LLCDLVLGSGNSIQTWNWHNVSLDDLVGVCVSIHVVSAGGVGVVEDVALEVEVL
jgi:hypothetical protein